MTSPTTVPKEIEVKARADIVNIFEDVLEELSDKSGLHHTLDMLFSAVLLDNKEKFTVFGFTFSLKEDRKVFVILHLNTLETFNMDYSETLEFFVENKFNGQLKPREMCGGYRNNKEYVVTPDVTLYLGFNMYEMECNPKGWPLSYLASKDLH